MTNTSVGERRQRAQAECQRALDHYQKGNRAAALKALGTALDLDRSLENDERIQRFAARLAGMRAADALATLTDVAKREALIRRAGKGTNSASTSLQSRPLWIIGIALMFVTFIGLAWLISSGQLTANTLNPLAGKGEVETFQLERRPEQTYMVVAPYGTAPENGWPTLVAVHGAGQTGQDMVDALAEATKNTGILLIAPTFPTLRDDNTFYEDGRSVLMLIRDEMELKAFSQPMYYSHYMGAVYFGMAEGAPLVTYAAWKGLDYAEVGYTMNGPLAVALLNGRAPLFDTASYSLHATYLLMYGEMAAQAGISRDYNRRLSEQGAAVTLMQADGADDKLTVEQIHILMAYVLEMYKIPTETSSSF
ncbi:MAG: hypothetical protein R3E39_24415 [Anaerolineae bacterium]